MTRFAMTEIQKRQQIARHKTFFNSSMFASWAVKVSLKSLRELYLVLLMSDEFNLKKLEFTFQNVQKEKRKYSQAFLKN